MASVTVTIPNADVADVFAAYTQAYRDDAIRLFYANDAVAYNNDTAANRGAALLKASIVVTTRNYRTNQAVLAVQPGTEPSIT
jgi:hypothetical protein